jgi:hypothetical protein
MNARELKDKHTRCIACYREEEWALIQQALSLLAAAEANDGSTPETDAAIYDLGYRDESGQWIKQDAVPIDFARTLEQQRNGLAARVRELGLALAKIAGMSAPRATSVQREINTAALDAFSAPIIDARNKP